MRSSIWMAGHRLSLAWLALACAAVAYLEPTSLMAANLIGGGAVGQLVMAAIVCMALGALLDVACNDLPAQPMMPWLMTHRGNTYAVQSVTNLLFVYALLRPGQWTWVAGIYLVLAAGSMWVSAQDAVRAVAERRGHV